MPTSKPPINLSKGPRRKNIQVQMAQRTLNIIEKAKHQLNTDNRSEIVKTMVDISDMVINALSEGGTVIIESKDGTRNKIVIPGISK